LENLKNVDNSHRDRRQETGDREQRRQETETETGAETGEQRTEVTENRRQRQETEEETGDKIETEQRMEIETRDKDALDKSNVSKICLSLTKVEWLLLPALV